MRDRFLFGGWRGSSSAATYVIKGSYEFSQLGLGFRRFCRASYRRTPFIIAYYCEDLPYLKYMDFYREISARSILIENIIGEIIGVISTYFLELCS